MEDKKFKILFWDALTKISGGQQVGLEILDKLKGKYDFKVVIPKPGPFSKRIEKLSIPVEFVEIGNYSLGKKKLVDIIKFLVYTPKVIYQMVKVCKDYDLIYANSGRIFIWSAILGEITKLPVIWHLHLIFSDQKVKNLINFFGKFNCIKKIISVSNAAADQFPKLKDKIELIYNGIDLSNFVFKPNTSKTLKKHIGVIGSLIPQKGQLTLIKAVNLIKDKLPVKVFIVGAPYLSTIWYEKKLKKLVKKFNLEEQIIFLGYKDNINQILPKLDLLILPSTTFEACPMVILEAYASGVPVIGSDLGGIPELIQDGKTGFIFKANDELDLAKKILKFFKNSPEKIIEMKSNCRKIAEEKFNLDKLITKIERVLNQTLQNH